jgi:Holliday junction resolvase
MRIGGRVSLNRYAKKRDKSEPEIVEALQAAGFKVWRELPVDLLAYRAGRFYVLECKTRQVSQNTLGSAVRGKMILSK